MTYRKRNKKEHSRPKHRVGPVQRKILLLLLGGLALGCSGSPSTSWKIIRAMHKEWRDVNKQNAERAIAVLYKTKLIEARKDEGGTVTMVLSDNGKKRALTYNLGTMQIKKPETWDGNWRVVLFDIPEEKRGARDSLRTRLLNLGFFELQRSVLVHPYECRDEIEFLIEMGDIRPYVRYMRAHHIDNEPHLKRFFRIA